MAMDAVVPGPAGGGGEALEGVMGVGGAGRPAAAAAVGHRVERGVVWGQLLRRGGRGERGGSWDVSSSQRQRTTVDKRVNSLTAGSLLRGKQQCIYIDAFSTRFVSGLGIQTIYISIKT